MIQIKVNSILGLVKYLGGQRTQNIKIKEDSDVMDVMDLLIELYGISLKERVFSSDRILHKGIVIMLNGRNIFALQGLETKISNGDELLLFPPVAGG